ncbi:hypothetical protein Tco_1217140 [Tanacetum coccineum]
MTMLSRCSVDQPVVNCSYSSPNKAVLDFDRFLPDSVSFLDCGDEVFASSSCHPLTIPSLHALLSRTDEGDKMSLGLGLRTYSPF